MNMLLETLGLVLLATAATAGLALLLYWLATRSARRQALAYRARRDDYEERAQRGVWANATVVNLRNRPEQEHIGPATRVRVDLRLQVDAPGGQKYSATTAWIVDSYALAQLQPGQPVSVKIDPDDPQKIYPNVSWAVPWLYD